MKACLVAATILTTVGCVATQTEQPARSPTGAAREGGVGEYRLDRLAMLSRVILSVNDNYVDPARIDPRRMVVAALDSVAKSMPEVIVQGEAASAKLTLIVGSSTHELDISTVDTIWKVRTVLVEAMSFMQQHLVASNDPKQIEYAAVQGMLSTLDPLSVLLEPRHFKEMRLQRRVGLGGLGFIFALREGNLTVVKTRRNTPAHRAGFRHNDVITEINGESTVNMDLQDAVDRMRGEPRSEVSLAIMRAGWPEPKRFLLTREVIQVETVAHAALLDGKIGYVKLSQLASNTIREVERAIRSQVAQSGGKLEGLVLDLRGCPGGLLEQAIEISDLFLAQGVILVKTVGGGKKQRIDETRVATAHPDDLVHLPLVVIVNGKTASGSEIVASALKENGRALVIGRPTSGVDSIQVLHDFQVPGRPTEEMALMLTIARYLTPSGASIEGIGVTPDVLLLPGRAPKEQVQYFAPRRSSREGAVAAEQADTEKKRVAERAPLELRYLLDEERDEAARGPKRDAKWERGSMELTPDEQEDEESEADPERFVEDHPIRFARELLMRAPHPDRPTMLEAAKALVAQRRAEEEARLAKRFAEMGVDWTDGVASGTPRAVVTMTPSSGSDFRAGDMVPWTVTVENRGDAPFRRLRAWTRSEKNSPMDRREFLFGAIKPGERRSWTVPVRVPTSNPSVRDEVILHFEDGAGRAPPHLAISFGVVEKPKPLFAFSVQIDDRMGGNGDGRAQRGEAFTVRVEARNVGAGASSEKTYVSLKNLGDESLFIKKARDVIGALEPGQSRSAAIDVELRRGSTSDELPVQIQVVDENMDERATAKLSWPVAQDGPPLVPAKATVRAEVPETMVRSGAAPSAPPIASARQSALLSGDAKIREFWRVEWKKGRFGFVADADVKPVQGSASGSAAEVWQHQPLRIAITPDPTTGAPMVEGDTLRLQGVASLPPSVASATKLRHVLVTVGDRKVFFQQVRESTDTSKLEFQADLPLKTGRNEVTVIARGDDGIESRRSVVVYRRVPKGAE